MKRKELSCHIIFAVILIASFSILAGGCSDNKKSENKHSDYASYNTYAFFGVDTREDRIAGYSDVIMLVNIEEDNNQAKMVSVYRDTFLDIAGDGTDFEKCNWAYRYGGPYGAIDMLEKNLDTRISGYASANFLSIADAIDSVGGVSVNVENMKVTEDYTKKGEDVVAIMNKYIAEMNDIYDRDTPYIEHPGEQTLTGIQAVAYSRVRYTDGGDMKRSERQRDVVTLLLEKLKTIDESERRGVLKDLYKTIDTDLSETELMSLFDTLNGLDIGDVQGFPYYKTEYNLESKKIYIVVPCDLTKNVTELHKRLYGEEDYQPSDIVTKNSKLIEEETGIGADDADDELNNAY